jgi:cytochrome c-type biogenesis protein
MLDDFFFTVNNWMTMETAVAAGGCLFWGMISVVFSPCHMAAIPLIVSYVAGQDTGIKARHASCYACAFTVGLFITVALVGTLCTILGLMLGEIGPYWSIMIGAVLLWVGWDTFKTSQCSLSTGILRRIRIRGISGAMVLGLLYGLVSGSCTFGFLAPILAMITVQQKVLTGALFICIFTLGYSIPVAIAGCSAVTVKRVLESRSFHSGGLWLRRCAGTVIGLMGVYFILRPFI